jgi:hypothetical protein
MPFFLAYLDEISSIFFEFGIQISFDLDLSSDVALAVERGVRVLPTNGLTLSKGLDEI